MPRDFFTRLDHGWLREFLERRIADERVLRLIYKWVNAGVIEDGRWQASEAGAPQGASASLLLANIYLHYVLDQWAKQWRDKHARGDMVIVRFADDFVCGFEHQGDAKQFLHELRKQFADFGLELHPEKTRLIEFGRYAAYNRKARGLGKPETFDFLGFTHICGKGRDGNPIEIATSRNLSPRQVQTLFQVSRLPARRRTTHAEVSEKRRGPRR